MSERVEIKKLPTGVPGLDAVLGGGLPELSFNLIAGGPGAGKTTLAHQIMFASASAERPALYITILGEPPVKMLRYQQQYAFFKPELLPSCVRFVHLGAELMEGGLQAVLDEIVRTVEQTSPRLVFVDSFRSIALKSEEPGQMELQSFVQRLSLHLTGWEATTFLIGEYEQHEADCNPIFTVADGIIWLSQAAQGRAVVRRAQVVKMRGQGPLPGLHTMQISQEGVRIFPRAPELVPALPAAQVLELAASAPRADRSGPALPEGGPVLPEGGPAGRRGTGIAALDAMLGGGIAAGSSLLISGPSGAGKTVIATQFLREGLERGERAVLATFEARRGAHHIEAPGAGELRRHLAEGRLAALALRPLDLSADEILDAIGAAVRRLGAQRVVIDSLLGLELALAPPFRDELREALHRLVHGLTGLGASVVMTAEQPDSFTELRLGPEGVAFLVDGVLLLRYVELGGELRKVLAVAKLRGSEHAKELRLYDIDARGVHVGEPLVGYEGILAGAPRRRSGS